MASQPPTVGVDHSSSAEAVIFNGFANFSTIVIVGFLAARSISLT